MGQGSFTVPDWDTVRLFSNREAPMAEKLSEDNLMATSTTNFSTSHAQQVASTARIVGIRRRQITPQAGKALQILGHAIEYLTDEFVHAGGDLSSRNPQLQAVQLLMALNRQVYFECPEVPTVRERIHAMFHSHSA
jgi:hypothetical protein